MLNFVPGKGPPRADYDKAFKMVDLLKVENLPPLPEEDDVDVQVGGIDDHFMWRNGGPDGLGNCVVADFAGKLLRDEKYEQGIQINIPDTDVVNEYFTQTGGVDSGLVMLDYLSHLRHEGIVIEGKTYKIHAYATIDWKDHIQVRRGIQLFRGVYFGMMVPQSMIDQFNAGEILDYVPGSPNKGGHAVYSPAHLEFKVDSVTEMGPVFRTWAKRVQATWALWDNTVDEAYIIIDERDTWVDPATNPLDTEKLDAMLSQVTSSQPNPEPSPIPTPPGCMPFSRILAWFKKKLG